MFQTIPSAYIHQSTFIQKKAQYTRFFLCFITIAMATLMLLETVIMGATPTKMISFLGFIAAFFGLFLLHRKGQLAVTVSLLILAGLVRNVQIMWYPEAFQFYLMSALCMLITGVIHLHKWQFKAAVAGFALQFLIRFIWSYHLYTVNTLSLRGITQTIYASILFILFIFATHFLIDIIDREIEEADALQRLANTDPLTGLLNRRHFNLATEASPCAESSLLLFDLDHFKQVNDHFGHTEGDRVLEEFSVLLRSLTRHGDQVYRWGGEEFAVLARDTCLDEAYVLAERIRDTVAGHTFPVHTTITVSAGVAELQQDETMDRLMVRADQALYAAKEAGRNRVVSAL